MIFYSTSSGIEFPIEYVEEARKLGFETTTVGSVIASHYGGDEKDPHSILTGGVIRRSDLLVEALKVVFAQIIQSIK